MINSLINRFHSAVERQSALSTQFCNRGIQPSQLVNKDLMLAFAALGDHDRAGVLQKLSADSWQALEERAIVRGEMDRYSTPELRLLSNMLAALLSLDEINARFDGDSEPAPPGVIRVQVKPKKPLWGQPIRLEYEVHGVDYVRIRADDIFRRRTLIRHVEEEIEHRYVELPADNGDVVFTLLMRDGRVLEHRETLQLPTWEEDCAHER